MQHYIKSVECLDCGHHAPFHHSVTSCPKCNSTWREIRYDLDALSTTWEKVIKARPFNLWRYREMLPIQNLNPDLFMGEGGTPFIRAVNLGLMLANQNIFIKDERQGPTSSFKDRQAAVSIAALKESGISELVIASTGNVALAYSAYAARAGIKLWTFLTSLVPASKMREVGLYGSQVVKVTGSYDQAKQIAAEFARQRGVHFDLGSRSIPCIESMKTIAYEIVEQLSEYQLANNENNNPNAARYPVPDWYIQSVSGGMGPLGVYKGFCELLQMGWVDRIPKLAIIQVEGCSPMVKAWKQDQEIADPVRSPKTLIHTLATGDPGRAYTLLRNKMLSGSGGAFESVTDEEAFRALHILAKMEGFSIEPAAAVAFAGLIKLVRSGVIKSHETVVVNCSGHAMPVERNILGDDWSGNLFSPSETLEESHEEGLLAALSNVAIDRFPRIAIVDDNPDVRRLIRKILESQGNYQINEATNGKEAIELIKIEKPNLVLLDLMMPEVDGFSVLDAMQADSATAEIPVIVITAKELTTDEKDHLRGRIQSLVQKGDLISDKLAEEVRGLLG
ncbi:MAG: pyridoxal-phosphate dependent enzyme [Anaerolineae bacterium]|nr:pyridoxal-phosphate dependent enzyme [Anaerolineae bacterium]